MPTLLLITLLAGISVPSGYDVVSLRPVISAMSPGGTVDVPLYVRDRSGTLLGVDGGAFQRIQGLAVTFEVSPPGAVTGISASRAGVTSGLTPLFETTAPALGDRFSWIAAFDGVTAPLNLTSDGPGDLVTTIHFHLSMGLAPDTVVNVDVVAPSALGNQPGTYSERPQDGTLNLVGTSLFPSASTIFVDGFESGDSSVWSLTRP